MVDDAPREVTAKHFAAADDFDVVADIVLGRCSMCHAREPAYDGIRWAPKQVYLETKGDIAGAARQIYLQAGVSHAMPPANLTWMEPEERATIIRWYRGASKSLPFYLTLH